MCSINKILDERRLRLRRAALKAAVIGVVVLVTPLVVGRITVVCALGAGSFAYHWSARGPFAVVWLRRFHRNDPQRFRFDRVLSGAGFGLFTPFTVQDSAFRTSYISSLYNTLLVIPVFFVVTAVASFFGALVISDMVKEVGKNVLFKDFEYYIFITTAFVFWGLSFLWLGKLILYRRGYIRLDEAAAKRVTLTLIEKAHRRRGSFYGVTVVKCDDAFWQQVVAIAIERADAVIFDVTEVTENLAWELRTCFEKKVPKAVVLACAEKDPVALGQSKLSSAVRASLDALVDGDRIAQCPVLLYPEITPGITLMGGYRAWQSRLRNVVAAALSEGRCPPVEREPASPR